MEEHVYFGYEYALRDPAVALRYRGAIVAWQSDADIAQYEALQPGESMSMHVGFSMLLLPPRCVAVADLHVQRLGDGRMRAVLSVGLRSAVIAHGQLADIAAAMLDLDATLDALEVGHA